MPLVSILNSWLEHFGAVFLFIWNQGNAQTWLAVPYSRFTSGFTWNVVQQWEMGFWGFSFGGFNSDWDLKLIMKMFSDFRNKKRTRVSFCNQRTRPLLGSNKNDGLSLFYFCASQPLFAAQVSGKFFSPCRKPALFTIMTGLISVLSACRGDCSRWSSHPPE